MSPSLNIVLNVDEVNKVLESLSEKPYKEVRELIDNIGSQAQREINRLRAEEQKRAEAPEVGTSE